MVGGIERSAKATNKLSDRAVRAFVTQAQKGTASKVKLADGGGLYVTMTSAGTPVWRLKYRLGGKEGLYSIGPYPAVSLEAARSARDEAKALIRVGRDPVEARQVGRVEASAASDATFGAIAGEWLKKQQKDWTEVHYDKSRRALERDVFQLIGRLPVGEITPAMVAAVIEGIMSATCGTPPARSFSISAEYSASLRGAGSVGTTPPRRFARSFRVGARSGRRPALLDLESLRDVLRRAELAALSPSVRLAHRLCAFTATRIGNVVEAKWSEFDLDADVPSWTIPRAKMKVRQREYDHRVLLGPTIAAELRLWQSRIGSAGYVFPSPTGRAHITRESLEKVYRVTLGLANKHSLHGWRAAFSTLARDAEFSRDVVELTLDHIHDTAVARAYDRGERIVERKKLMEWWDAQFQPVHSDPTVLAFRSGAA